MTSVFAVRVAVGYETAPDPVLAHRTEGLTCVTSRITDRTARLHMSVPATTPRVSKRLRFEILRRDNHTCRYCGGTAPDVKLTVDHVVPTALGGSNDPSNLVTACADCNSGKSATPADASVVEDVAQDAERWKRALLMAAEEQSSDKDYVNAVVESFDYEWGSWWCGAWGCPQPILNSPGYDAAGMVAAGLMNPVPRPKNWRESIEQMMTAGLVSTELVESARVALGKDSIAAHKTWKYFCGVAYTKLRQRQERARALMDSGEV